MTTRFISFLSSCLTVFGLGLFSLPALGQAPQERFALNHYAIEDGLSQNAVTDILQDHLGYMWLGTEDGLNRYDGYDFLNFGHLDEDSTSLSNSYIRCLYQDHRQRLWIGTSEGLNRFIPELKKFKQYLTRNETSLNARNIRCVYEDSQGVLWVGTDGGLRVYDEERDRFVPPTNFGLVRVTVLTMFEDREGVFWVGTENGLYQLDRAKKRLVFFQDFGRRITGPVNKILQDREGRVWFGTETGLFRLDKRESELEAMDKLFPEALDPLIVKDFHIDRKNRLWVASYGSGLWIHDFRHNKLTHLKHQQDLPSTLSNDIVLSLFESKAEILWIGTYNGLDVYDQGRAVFTSYYSPLKERLKDFREDVWAVHQTPEGDIWSGTYDGLFKMSASDGSYTHFKHTPGENKNQLPNNHITAIVPAEGGKLWLGTTEGGLSRLDPKTERFENFVRDDENPNQGPADNSVWALFRDRNNILWIGTSQGLSRFDPKTQRFLHYRKSSGSKSLSDNNVWSICEGPKGYLWVATSSGLNRFDRKKGTFETFYHQESDPEKGPSNNYIVCLHADEEGILWLGTHSGGLNSLNLESMRFKHYTERKGLASGVIYGITEDESGNLWLATNRGISRFNRSSERFHNYDTEDGLLASRFNHSAICKTQKGELLFGNTRGINLFHPDSIQDNPYIPPVYITTFKIFNKVITPHNSELLAKDISETPVIQLSHEHYVISLDFVALGFRQSGKNRFTYKLEGFDEEWNYTDSRQRTATYTNLKPGIYKFRVKASNNDGIWNDQGAELTIIVKPPFWDELWFRIVVILLVVIILTTAYRMRVRNIELRRQDLERLVAQQTNDLRREKDKLEHAFEEIKEQKEQILNFNTDLQQKQEEILAQRDDIEQQRNEVQRAAEQIRILTTIGQELTRILDLSELLDTVQHQVSGFMSCDGFGLGLYDEVRESLVFENFWEDGKILPTHQEPLSADWRLSVWCFRHQKEVFINDLRLEFGRYIKGYQMKVNVGRVPNALIYLPLTSQGKRLGVLTLQSFKKGAYTQAHVEILKTLASYISIALENASSYEEIKKAHETIRSTNMRLTDSIRYAQTIQAAILPEEALWTKLFPEHFILYQPKDYVSGDFYWLRQVQHHIFVAVADCTGHGVPGAFMSMVGTRLLNELILQQRMLEPEEILTALDEQIRYALKQEITRNDDGMDIALCRIDQVYGFEHRKVTFAGAKRPLLYVKNQEIHELRGQRRHIGGVRRRRQPKPFEQSSILLDVGDRLYLYSDGYIDQASPDRKKFGSVQLKTLLSQTYSLSLSEQKTAFVEAFVEHKLHERQRDDITFIGIKF